MQHAPCSRVGRQTTHKIENLMARLCPIDTACLFENFWCRFQRYALWLWRLGRSAGYDAIHRFDHGRRSDAHQTVVDGAGVVVVGDGRAFLQNQVAGVNLLL